MRVLGIGLLAAIVVLVPSGTQAGTQIVRPHAERDKMSETRKRELVLDDLKSLVVGPATATSLTTKPYASSTNGLCQRDVVQLKYELKREGKPSGSFSPIGISSLRVQYHFLDWTQGRSWQSWNEACEKLSGQQVNWTFAEDDHYASYALSTLKMTVSDVRKGERYTIDCRELDGPHSDASCVAIFLSAADQVSEISRRHTVNRDVYGFTATPYEFTITRTYPRHLNGQYTTEIKIRHQEILVT